MRIFRYLIKKEFLQLKRDRKMLPLVFLAPIMQLILLGFAANLDVQNIKIAVLDMDRSVASRDLVESFLSTSYFTRVGSIDRPDDVENLLLSGDATVVLSISGGFQADLITGDSTSVQLIIDGTNSTVGSAVMNYANGIVRRFQAEAIGDLPGAHRSDPQSALPVTVVPRVWYNPEMESKNFMVPGILAMLLMLVTMVLASLAIVKEKELGTLEQLNVTPISATQMIIGKLIPFIIIGIIDILLVLFVAKFVFSVPFRGSVLVLFAASLLFLASTLGLGLFISTISENQQQAMLTAAFFVMIPMFFLSGFAFPIASMPRIIRWVTYLFPLRYYLDIIRGVFLKGVGFVVLREQFAALTIFGAVILTLAAARFRKRTR